MKRKERKKRKKANKCKGEGKEAITNRHAPLRFPHLVGEKVFLMKFQYNHKRVLKSVNPKRRRAKW